MFVVQYVCLSVGGGKQRGLPDYETINRSIPELKERGSVLLPWKEEYKEVLGRYLVQDVQYNWDENDEKRLK